MISSDNTTIGVQPATPDQFGRAERLAAELQIPLVLEHAEDFQFLLICFEDSLALRPAHDRKTGPISAGFTGPTMQYRLKHGTGRRQNLARAVGLKKGWQPFVIDATGGLGRDGFVLAHLGCRVHILERSPVLAVMIRDGLERAKQAPSLAETAGRIEISLADSKEFLMRLRDRDRPEVIYLDPMYPERIKSSLVKKEMRILRSLVGVDPDAPELLRKALKCALNRVVVKRPRLAPALGGLEPSHVISGKTSRFDVYVV